MRDQLARYNAAKSRILLFYKLFDEAKAQVGEASGLKDYNLLFCQMPMYSKKRNEWFPIIEGSKARKKIPEAHGETLLNILFTARTPPSSVALGRQERQVIMDLEVANRLKNAWIDYLNSWQLTDARRNSFAKTTSTETGEAIQFTERLLSRLSIHKDALSDKKGLQYVLDEAIFNVRKSGNNVMAMRNAEKLYRVFKVRPSAMGLSGNIIPIARLNVLVRLSWTARQSHDAGLVAWTIREMAQIDRDHRDAVGLSAYERIINEKGKDDINSDFPYLALKLNEEGYNTPFFGYYDDNAQMGGSLYNAAVQAKDQCLSRSEKLRVLGNRTIEAAFREAFSRDKDFDQEGAAYDAAGLAAFLADCGSYDEAFRALEDGEDELKSISVPAIYAQIRLRRTKAKIYRNLAIRSKNSDFLYKSLKYFNDVIGSANEYGMYQLEHEIRTEMSEPTFWVGSGLK